MLEEAMMNLHINYNTLPVEKRRMMENIRMKNDILSDEVELIHETKEPDSCVRHDFTANRKIEDDAIG